MRSCGFCVRPTNLAGISFVALGREGLQDFLLESAEQECNTDLPSRIVMPQSSWSA